MNVLVIDDTEIVSMALTAELKQAGFEAENALTAKAAIEKAKTTAFDIVLTDLVMPDQNGVEICRAIKESHPKTRVILMCGHNDEIIDKMVAFLAAGGEVFLFRKPFPRGEITKVLKKLAAEQDTPPAS